MDQNRYHWILFLAVLILVGGCSAEQQESGNSNSAPSVDVVTVETKSLEETTSAIGSLEADQVVQIEPEVSGRLEYLGFEEGDTVLEDSVLFRLDDGELQARVRSRQSELEEARAQFKNARRTYRRQQRLYEQELTSGQSRDDAEEAFESARARVNRIQAELDEVQEQLEDATIRAPFDGIIEERRVDAGNVVEPGDFLTTLYRINPIQARFSVPERYAGRIHRDQTVRVHVQAFPNDTFEGTVTYVSPDVREQTRDLQVKAKITNSNFQLRPGMYAEVEIVLEIRPARPVIPSQSLVSTREGYIVYRLEENKVHRQAVTIGLRKPGMVEIRDGLAPGERVVRSGHMILSDGMNVQTVSNNENSE